MADWLALSAAIAASSNKALHLTAIPLRSIAAGELGRSAFSKNSYFDFL